MQNVSDLLKSEAFRENQLYELLTSKFKPGTIPTDKKEFLNCFSYDKDRGVLRFYHKFSDISWDRVEVFFGTSRTEFGDWTSCYLRDKSGLWTFTYDYLKTVVKQLDCIDRIQRLTTSAEAYSVSQTIAAEICSKIWDEDSSSKKDCIQNKVNELKTVAQKRISQLEYEEEK